MANTYTHPVLTNQAELNLNNGAPIKTQLRRATFGYTTKELNKLNADIAKGVRKKQLAKAAKKKKKKKKKQ